MKNYSLSHLSDQALLQDLTSLVARDRATTAALLAHVAEVDVRRLYVPAGYPSMHAYCVDALHLSEDAAYKRIQAARAARQFPDLFVALSEGRLHLTAVCLLAPHLNSANVEQLITEATHQRKCIIERRLAERFPRSEGLAMVETIPPTATLSDPPLAPAQVGKDAPEYPAISPPLAPAQVEASTPPPRLTPLSSESFLLTVTIGKHTHDALRHAQALLAHSIPSGDVAQVLDRALTALVQRMERRRFGATPQPRARQDVSTNPRYVPNQVRRAVWAP